MAATTSVADRMARFGRKRCQTRTFSTSTDTRPTQERDKPSLPVEDTMLPDSFPLGKLDGQAGRIIDATEEERSSGCRQILIGRLAGSLPVAIVINDEHAP